MHRRVRFVRTSFSAQAKSLWLPNRSKRLICKGYPSFVSLVRRHWVELTIE
nr:MAG TPA: hypothetical protein [Caudoviricetes sp.]